MFGKDQNTIYIQYCRSCDTHNWCTHHDESKYHDTFLKFSDMITRRLPHLEIIGNMVPPHLIPFKIAENKYIDANTNKYVVFPHIGSFEVTYQRQLIFSKKNTHNWPNLNALLNKIVAIADPHHHSPHKEEHNHEDEHEDSRISNQQSFVPQQEEKKSKHKTQQKGFTLTDHFKLYRPKNNYQEKDWLTEKQESQASSKHISEMGRLQSRQKSNKSLESKKSSDLVGQSKLKQMLKHKGALSKQHGKKEMIIRLDSIQEENVGEEGAAATQRTQQKNVKKNRMKEIDEQINSLEDKFKNFENRVHDIQARKKEFQQKDDNGEDKSRFRQIIQNQSQLSRDLSSKLEKEGQSKQRALFADKTNKLQQYLNYSQQEKNDKLHRIYGEWKLIKPFPPKNKKLAKGSPQKPFQGQDQEDSSSQQTSKADSHSPSSFANIIAFKHKNQNSRNGKARKQHKYSSVERYNKGSSKILHSNKNNTDNNFYKNHRLINQKPQIQSDAEIKIGSHNQQTSKLIKKSFNTLSMNALKSLANNANLPKIQADIDSVQSYSQSAQQDISKIHNRISKLQAKLKNHNKGTFSPIQQSPYNQRDKNYSKNSQSQSGSQNKVSLKKINHIYNTKVRDSNVSSNTIKKNYSHKKMKPSNFTELARPQAKKFNNEKGSEVDQQESNAREEQYKPHMSKRKEAKYIESDKDNPVVRQTHNEKTLSSQSTNRFSNVVEHTNKNSKSKEEHKKLLKKESKKTFQEGPHQNLMRMMKNEQRKVMKRRIQRKPQQTQPYDYSQQQEQQNANNYEYQPHKARQAKPLQRQFKVWRESQPLNKRLRSKQFQRKQSLSKERREQSIVMKKQEEVKTNKQRSSKQAAVRKTKQKSNNKSIHNKINANSTIIEEKSSNVSRIAEQKKVRSGQIKKNRIVKQSIHKQRVHDQLQSAFQNRNEGQLYSQSQNRSDQDQQEQNYEEEPSQFSQQQQREKTIPSNQKKITKNLGYFKTAEMCFKGDEQLNTQHFITNKQYPQRQQKQRNDKQVQQGKAQSQKLSQFVPQCKKQRRNYPTEQKEELEGWNNTNSNEQQNEIVPSDTQEPLDNVMRKNSLDREIQGNNCLEQQQPKEPQQPTYKSEALVNKQSEESNETAQIAQTTKQVYLDPISNSTQSQQFAKQSKMPTKNQSQVKNITEVKETQNQQRLLSKKVKKQQRKQKKPQLKQPIKDEQIDVDQIACRQYSQFLQYKIPNDLCFELQEKAQYQDCEYKVNLINCKSEQSIQQSTTVNFMNFQSSKPVVKTEIAQEEEDENQCSEEEYSEQFEEQAQELEREQAQEKEQEKGQSQNNQQNNVERTVVVAQTNLQPGNHQIFKGQQVNRQQKVVQHKQENNLESSNSSNILGASHSPQNIQQKPTSLTEEKVSTQNSKETFDNVYSEQKKQQTSKFVEMGVQKQLTMEVSIQTDSHFQKDTVYMAKQGTIFEQERAQSKRSKNSRLVTVHDNKTSELSSMARNKFYPQNRQKEQIFRAKIVNQIASSNKTTEMDKFQTVINGKEEYIIRQDGSVAKMSEVYNKGIFIKEESLEIEMIQTKFPSFLKALEILAERGDWILTRLFQDAKGVLQEKAFGVWLCKNFKWECLVIDDNIKVNEANKPLYTYHIGNQKWANVLQKAISQALGGYQKLATAQTSQIFTLLTGCNAISVKIKEDPSKNAKLLQLITECQRKNYIVHAQKNMDKAKYQKDRQSIYYLQTVRKSNGEEQALVQISQDGRQSFWMRLSKFTQQFSKVEILQLRVNHQFTHIEMGIGKQNKITVIELNFLQSGQGCVTLTYMEHAGPLFAYLYKQQKSKVLKLVGQAREKQKSHLFFQCNFNEGRYYVFAQTKEREARLCYYGQNIPALRITQEILNDGLKNEVAEYLPIKDNTESRPRRQMQQNWTDWRGKTPRLKDNFMQSRLRENFVQYILGKTKRRDAQF